MSFQSWLRPGLVLLAVLLLFGCSDHRSRDRVKAASFSDLLERAGWERLAGDIPAGQSVEAALAAFGPGAYRWEVERKGALTEVLALPRDPATAPAWSFLLAGDAPPLLPAADAGGAFLLGHSPLVEAGAFTRLDRIHQVAQLHDGEARYRWGGCVRYDGPQVLRNLELRATLLDVDAAGQRAVRLGKSRRATRRSGIPKSLSPGEFFCTELESGKVPKGPAIHGGLSAVGVIEAAWTDDAGRPAFAILSAQPLDWRDYSQVQGEPFAVLEGGTIDTGDGMALTVPNPTLVNVLTQQGRQVMVRTSDGVQGLVMQDRLAARFPNPSPELSPERRHALSQLIRHSILGKPEEALALYHPDHVSEPLHEALRADMVRRYPRRLDAAFLTPMIQALAVDSVPGGDLVTVFVWLKNGYVPVWTTLDTVFFVGNHLRPILPAPPGDEE